MRPGSKPRMFGAISRLFRAGAAAGLSDAQLLERFLLCHDEAAFAALVERHGPMVLAACRRVLNDPHDAQDAFQATFLVLVRKAGAIRKRESIAHWLHGVALRVSAHSRADSVRRRAVERRARTGSSIAYETTPADRDVWDEVELLPQDLRAVVMLCYLEGLTHEQAARQLGWPVGTVRSRLARARDRLRDRLTRRGLAPDTAFLPMLSFRARSLPEGFIDATVKAAMLVAARDAGEAGSASASAAALTEGVLRTMFALRLKATVAALLAVGVITSAMGLYARQEKVEEPPPTAAEQIIDEALAKVTKLRSVSAQLVGEIQPLTEKVAIKGRYLRGPNARVYSRLTVSGLPGTEGTTLRVCDGETLWDYQAVRDSQLYRKFRIKPILDRLNSPDLDPKIKEQAMTQMGLAPPETVLAGLRRALRFEHQGEGALEGKKVWILRGSSRNRQGRAGPDSRPVVLLNELLPAYIPSEASLYLGKDDGWPYKLVLMGRPVSVLFDTRKVGPDGRRIVSLSSLEKLDPTKLTLEYTDVKLNAAITVDEFAFQAPSTAHIDDNTEVVVRMLDHEIAMQAGSKKVEAAKRKGRVAEQPVEIPRP
jgi:RNA polymerase sigma factor (sigma-70 family)